jgi:intracellular multiplication protein IcmE
MSKKGWPSAISINAIAISPKTARTAMATDINHHYFVRWGSIFVSSFLEGIGQAVQQSGSSAVNNVGATTTTFNNLNTGEKALVGLGKVGQALGQAAQKEFSREPTIYVKSGTGMGILFLQDVAMPSFLETQSSTEGSNIGA